MVSGSVMLKRLSDASKLCVTQQEDLGFSQLLFGGLLAPMQQNCVINEAALALHTLGRDNVPLSVDPTDRYDEAFWYTRNGDLSQKLRFDDLDLPHQIDYTYAMGKSWITSLDFTDNGVLTNHGMSHDLRGNVTRNLHLGLTELRYNAFSNLPTATTTGTCPSCTQRTYRYDQQGQRTAQRDAAENGTADYYLDHVILDETGRPKRYGIAEGFATLDQSNAPVKHYSITDHLGTPRITFNSTGVVDARDLHAYGQPMPGREFLSLTEAAREQFTGHEHDAATQLDYHGARYYDQVVGRYLGADPLGDANPGWTPYNYVMGNPVSLVDPTGRSTSPIYDRSTGELLGTDDEGLTGPAIVMDKSQFKQGMSHTDAMAKGTAVENACAMSCISSETKQRIDAHYAGLPSRPDYDGHLTLAEANVWYRTGNGQPLFTDLAKIDLAHIYSKGEATVGKEKIHNLLFASGSLNDGLVYGQVKLKRYPADHVRAYADRYDFDIHNDWNPLNWPRNREAELGGAVAGRGTLYEINIFGSQKRKPVPTQRRPSYLP